MNCKTHFDEKLNYICTFSKCNNKFHCKYCIKSHLEKHGINENNQNNYIQTFPEAIIKIQNLYSDILKALQLDSEKIEDLELQYKLFAEFNSKDEEVFKEIKKAIKRILHNYFVEMEKKYAEKINYERNKATSKLLDAQKVINCKANELKYIYDFIISNNQNEKYKGIEMALNENIKEDIKDIEIKTQQFISEANEIKINCSNKFFFNYDKKFEEKLNNFFQDIILENESYLIESKFNEEFNLNIRQSKSNEKNNFTLRQSNKNDLNFTENNENKEIYKSIEKKSEKSNYLENSDDKNEKLKIDLNSLQKSTEKFLNSKKILFDKTLLNSEFKGDTQQISMINSSFEKLEINENNNKSKINETMDSFLHFFNTEEKTLKIIFFTKGKYKITSSFINIDIPKRFRSISKFQDIFLIGGANIKTGKIQNIVYKINFQNNTIEKCLPMLHKRKSFGLCCLENYLFVIGGYNEEIGYLSNCEIYSIDTNKWEELPKLNEGVSSPSVCTFQNEFIYKFGGLKGPFLTSQTIEKYDIFQKNWTIINVYKEENIEIGWLTASAQISENRIIILGGIDKKNKSMNSILNFEIEKDNSSFLINKKEKLKSKGGFWYPNLIFVNNKLYILQNILMDDNSENCFENEQRIVCYENEKCIEIGNV